YFMTINVSSVQIQHLAHKQQLTRAIEAAGVRAGDIKLEFTESALIESPEQAAQALDDLKQAGVNFAIDDFGTGYSSLSYLQRFPLDVLKIDRSFITDLATNAESRQIVKAIMGLTKGLSMEVVAEGIESADTLGLLVDLGCDFVQGFMLSRPVQLDDALVLVKTDRDYQDRVQAASAVGAG
ncbi:MAG: EAL domain-containing protein, partial [Pseudomonadota bacterium]